MCSGVQDGQTTDDGTGLTERQTAERKSLRLGLGPNINPKAAGTGGGENEGTEDPLCPQLDPAKFLLRCLRMITLEL